MSIQQNFNQLLSLYGVGAGLYSQTPQGKEQAEVRGLERNIAQMEKVSESQLEENDFPSSKEGLEAALQEATATQRLAQLRPTEENLKKAAGAREFRENIEQLRAQEIAEKMEASRKKKSEIKAQFPVQRVKPRMYEHEDGTPWPREVDPSSNEYHRMEREDRRFNDILNRALQYQLLTVEQRANQTDAFAERLAAMKEAGDISNRQYKRIMYKHEHHQGGNQ